MAEPTEDLKVKVASNAAEEFVEAYYPALNTAAGRAKIPSWYIKPTPTIPCKPDISMNGTIIADPEALKELFEKQVEKSLYEVGSFDCQVLNTNYTVGAPEGMTGQEDGKKLMILVMVSGSVKYSREVTEGDIRGFTENVILVPNWEAQGPKAAKGDKKWLIQSQTFRLIL